MPELCIVHDKETSDIAQQLMALISKTDSLNARVLTERQWDDTKIKIDAKQRVLFLGKVNDGIALKPLINWEYEKINMKYGSIGQRFLIIVEEHKFSKDEKSELKTLLDEEIKNIKKKLPYFSTILIALINIPLALLRFSISVWLWNKRYNKKIYKLEYFHLLMKLFDNNGTAFNKLIGIDNE